MEMACPIVFRLLVYFVIGLLFEFMEGAIVFNNPAVAVEKVEEPAVGRVDRNGTTTLLVNW